ncbi:LamB/YcsF family protein [Xinfangfangia sp. D13-10-4-6]|uniref:LamB/YcsF family protein n=1 Tax=Pseudogemmobacter hezensis TaxID=2737662 RepID=UPI001551BD87|nr:5-oxoprolinase subunit PxpA [Pseudogemmobacter hezensis]NPD17509.1 LamB/YcsF family protein [Pseudogemmobacter hezensis]
MKRIDLNADLGEGYGPWLLGNDAQMLKIVSSANLACGGHAGDPETMFTALTQAKERGTVIGAHPGYADREGFGRRIIQMSPGAITRMLTAQIGALQALAALAGTHVHYVKPHGALANLAAADPIIASAICNAVAALPGELALLAISGTALEKVANGRDIPVYSEIFADRGYLPNGQLMPRDQPGAVLHDPDQLCQRMLDFLTTGEMPVAGGGSVRLRADSICIHGDTNGAVKLAQALRTALTDAGISISPFLSR